LAREGSGALDFLCQKVANINATIFTTDEPTRNTAAFDFVAVVSGSVVVIANFELGVTGIECAIERFHLRGPELKLARLGAAIAAESHLRWPIGEHVKDFTIGDIAELVVVEYSLATLVTRHSSDLVLVIFVSIESDSWVPSSQREAPTGVVGLAYIAINTSPPIFTLALFPIFS